MPEPKQTTKEFLRTAARTLLAGVLLLAGLTLALANIASTFVEGLPIELLNVAALLSLSGFLTTMVFMVAEAKRRREASITAEHEGLELPAVTSAHRMLVN